MWRVLGQIGPGDQSSVSFLRHKRDCSYAAFPCLHGQTSSPLSFVAANEKGFLESLSTYTNAILTVTWRKGLPLSWSKSRFLQSCCVDNFRLQMLPMGLHVLTCGVAKRVRARGRYLGSNLPFFLGHRFSSNWPLKCSIYLSGGQNKLGF